MVPCRKVHLLMQLAEVREPNASFMLTVSHGEIPTT